MFREATIRLPGEARTTNQIHKAVWAALGVPEKAERDFLYINIGDGETLVRGKDLPTEHSLPVRQFVAGQRVAVLLLVRAVTRGKRERLVDQDQLKDWLDGRMPGFGDIAIHRADTVKSEIKRHPVWAWHLHFDATITDAAAAEETMGRGVGRSKAFGFGMPVVVPVNALESEAA
ncbi:type I-E CRISPR-associated protein Cas6/Cse3/CasE [Acidihalobacter ferrooxydans]|uniref:Type I-E CRISPR-associated protein Cas6/Cse3/CasE n=1 Tax=Acidihalobacter ferrooxydans TaxID=1765967 RepID=A0A1P8UFS2_9GAMM|nr:type I-E CRISPR-associated protein Cas6/Cse3/CasE [Acidihalobacter ferrooxydans]APZ42641.1 hypothetical protein BW247_05625 [Acidihalobacter ferrooxydans]